MNLSFSGCGFLGLYHAGVVCCIQKYASQLPLNSVSGASAGALAACALLCNQPLDEMISQGLKISTTAREGPLGPFSPSFDLNKTLIDNLKIFLPEDAHTRVNGKLHVSLTRVHDGKNVIISQFTSKDDLIQAVVASSFIPMYSGFIPPKFRDVRYMDGGFSNNLPIIDEHTITVSPFCGETDICPKDDSSQLYHININNSSIEVSKHNMYRLKFVIFPPKPEILSQLCRQGFEDTLRFLYQNGLLSCSRCLEIQSTFIIETEEECSEYDPECAECKTYQLEVLKSNMPEQVVRVFQDAIEKANEGILNWIYKHRGLKLLSLLALPYMIPADLMYATVTKAVSTAPYITNGIWEFAKNIMGQITSIITAEKSKPVTKISCHLSVAEYDGADDLNVDSLNDAQPTNKMDLNFTLNLEDSEPPNMEKPRRKFSTTKLLSRKSSLLFNTSGDSDTFDHILDVTNDHEALVSYYYLDENNQVNFTEIFGITEKSSKVNQTVTEEKTKFINSQSSSNINHRHNSNVSDCESARGESEEEYLGLQDNRPESDQCSVP